jgi:capsular exopolysaccharide synthesis family protein
MKSLHPLDSTLTEYKKDEISFNFERYIQTLLDNKWRIFLFVLTVLVASYFIINSIKTQYKATATVLIEKKESNVVDVAALYGLDNESEEYLATEFEVLRSRPLAEKVVEKLDLTSHPAFQEEQGFALMPFIGSLKDKLLGAPEQSAEPAATSDAVEAEIARRELLKDYQDRLSIFPLRKTQLVEVSFEAPTPVLARDIANEHAEAYIEADLEARLERTKTAASWLAGQVEGLKADLSRAEQRLADYIEQENVIDIEGIQAVSSQELKDLNTDLVKVRAKLSEATIRREQVQSARRSNSEESLPSVQSDGVAQKLKLDVVLAQQKRAELGKRYGPEHPRMLAATSDLTTARSGLRDQINKIIERVDFEYNAALAEEADLQRRINLAQQNFFSTNRKGSKYLELQREVESNQRLFDLFYNRTKETTETIDLQSAHARILTPAEDPLQPSKPQKPILFLLAALGSLFLSIFYYIMRELFNTGIRDGEDVDQRIGLPLLGSLPSIKKSFVRPVVLNAQEEGERSKEGAIFKEAVNTVRTGLMLDRVDRPHKTIMVTSTIAGEGKSTIAGHLAYSYASVGRTLLIDCDLRTRGVSNMFGVNKTDMGLREVLSAEALLEQCVIGIDNNLDLLCANFTPLNPLKLISSPRFQSHIKDAAKKYNFVILDAPPVLPVSDPLVLSGYVDAVIYTIRARSTPYQHISRCLQSLQRVEAPVCGVVLNQLDMGGSYYSYYSYGNN